MNKSKRFSIVYETSMCVLAVLAFILAILDLSHPLSPTLNIADTSIMVIFIVDYIIRLILAPQKKVFVKSNILDLIAIIPFNSLFKIFRLTKLFKLVRLTKLLKLTKLSRVLVFFFRIQKKISKFLNTNGFKYMVILSITLVFLGGLGMHYVEDMDLASSLWWAFVTVTTVGYGDLSPATPTGRIIASILMIVGIGLIGSLTSTITSYFFNKKESKTYKDQVIDDIKEQLDHMDTLTDEDIDTIAAVLKSIKHDKQ